MSPTVDQRRRSIEGVVVSQKLYLAEAKTFEGDLRHRLRMAEIERKAWEASVRESEGVLRKFNLIHPKASRSARA